MMMLITNQGPTSKPSHVTDVLSVTQTVLGGLTTAYILQPPVGNFL